MQFHRNPRSMAIEYAQHQCFLIAQTSHRCLFIEVNPHNTNIAAVHTNTKLNGHQLRGSISAEVWQPVRAVDTKVLSVWRLLLKR